MLAGTISSLFPVQGYKDIFFNDSHSVSRVIDNSIYNELEEAFEDSSYINYHHLSLLCDRITATQNMVSIFRHGINNDDIGPIAKASFEETTEMFLKAAKHAELDIMTGVPGAQQYTWSWSTGDTTEDVSGLSAGTYTVTATDCNGCTATGSYTGGGQIQVVWTLQLIIMIH